jgi:hypothetical protein
MRFGLSKDLVVQIDGKARNTPGSRVIESGNLRDNELIDPSDLNQENISVTKMIG